MLFNPNLTCTVTTFDGVDIYGSPTSPRSYSAQCAVLRLINAAEKTEVRADASASRGRIDQLTDDAVLLFPSNVLLNHHDHVDVIGIKLRVNSIYPRVDLTGQIDHYEVGCGRAV